jgi:hypothetical protein
MQRNEDWVAAFHVNVPATVQQAAADMFETLAADTEHPIELELGGETISASPATAMDSPTVMEVPAQDCVGVWIACDSDRMATYKIYQVQAGAGASCAAPGCANSEECVADEQVACGPESVVRDPACLEAAVPQQQQDESIGSPADGDAADGDAAGGDAAGDSDDDTSVSTATPRRYPRQKCRLSQISLSVRDRCHDDGGDAGVRYSRVSVPWAVASQRLTARAVSCTTAWVASMNDGV